MQEELAGNLRQLKPLGSGLLLQDRFDSVFRRNLVEPDAPTQNEKRRQRKQRYKTTQQVGSVTRELHNETQELKKRNDQREKGKKDFVNDDVIMI